MTVLLRSVEERSQWRKLIHEAANPQIEDGWRYKYIIERKKETVLAVNLMASWKQSDTKNIPHAPTSSQT